MICQDFQKVLHPPKKTDLFANGNSVSSIRTSAVPFSQHRKGPNSTHKMPACTSVQHICIQSLKNPSERKANSLGRLQVIFQTQQRLGRTTESASDVSAWKAGLESSRTGLRPLTTSALACYTPFQPLSWVHLVHIKTMGKANILLGAHTYFV